MAQDGPEYYSPRGGLLAFDMHLGDLVEASAPTGNGRNLSFFEGHFRLVNAQLAQVPFPHASTLEEAHMRALRVQIRQGEAGGGTGCGR